MNFDSREDLTRQSLVPVEEQEAPATDAMFDDMLADDAMTGSILVLTSM